MTVVREFQPYLNPDLNQPRTCVWLTPEDIEDFQLLNKLNDSIVNNKSVISGFTGVDKKTLLIQFPQYP